jgi:hypothetical protein
MGAWVSSSSVTKMEVEHQLQVRQLQSEIDSLKRDNDTLRKDILTHLAVAPRGQDFDNGNTNNQSQVSVAHVEQFVQSWLDNPNTNLSFVPDAIERPMLRNLLVFFLHGIGQTVQTTRIELVNHEIVSVLRPVTALAPEPKSSQIPSVVNISGEFDATQVVLKKSAKSA